jgi:hypothetical protein
VETLNHALSFVGNFVESLVEQRCGKPEQIIDKVFDKVKLSDRQNFYGRGEGGAVLPKERLRACSLALHPKTQAAS